MTWELPKSVEIHGNECEIRTDYRVALDICVALEDPELSDTEKALTALDIFYPAFEDMPPEHYQEAIEKCMWFINCGGDDSGNQKAPKFVDWEQDFPYIIAPINRVCGYEVRSVEYMHWWSFISAYYEIGGDCTFAQIVNIRSKLAHGKKLDKSEREWYQKNRQLVDFKQTYTEAEQDTFKQWGVL